MNGLPYIKYIILILGFSFIGRNETYASNPIDSIQNLLLTSDLEDTSRVNLLLKLSNAYYQTNPDTASDLLLEALQLSEAIERPKFICISYFRLCYFHFWVRGNPQEGKNYVRKIQQILPAFPSSSYETNYHLYAGLIDLHMGIYDTAASHLLEAHSRFMEVGNTYQAGICLTSLGTVYWRLGELEKALEYYQQYLEQARTENDGNWNAARGTALGNIALIYKDRKEYEEALNYFRESLHIHLALGVKADITINYQNVGTTHESLGNLDSAYFYYQKAFQLANEIQDPSKIIRAKHGLGAIQTLQGEYQQAQLSLESALKQALELQYRDLIAGLYLSLSALHEQTNQHAKALSYRKDYEVWKDSLTSEKHLNRVKELELKYETAEKEKQISFLTQEAEIQELNAQRQTSISWVLALGILLTVVIAALLIQQARDRLKHQRLLAMQQETLAKTQFQQKLGELELKALRAQMNPHFVFNCLNSINHLTLYGDTNTASLYLTKFSKLLRQVLENSEKSLIPVSEELEMLSTYVDLEALRFEGRIQMEIDVEPDLETEDMWIPPMILQPIVENAIWHGLMHKEGQGKIVLRMEEGAGVLKCIIEDDGVGRAEASKRKVLSESKDKSFGLQLTKERLHVLDQKGTNGKVRMRDREGGGTIVEIWIPIQ